MTLPFCDPVLPAVEVLLTDQAAPVLAAALDATGHDVAGISIAQVRYRPGRSITVSYHAHVTDTSGARRRTTLVATSGPAIPAGALELESNGLRLGVWRYPSDPALPGLRHAVDADLLAQLLAEAGLPRPVRRIRTRAYRPTRRAVVEVTTTRRTLYVKVVRPAKAAALVERHERIAAALPAPAVVASRPELGVLILGAVAGRPLRAALAEPGAALPSAAELIALLDLLPPLDQPTPGPLDRLDDHAGLIAAVAPGLADSLGDLRDRITAPPAAERVPVHGDFHAGQVMTLDGRAHGLVDVDTVGQGHRADDLATMLGYLAARATDPDGPARAAAYGARLFDEFAAATGPDDLRPRVAAALVAFATIPFITQRPGWPDAVARRVGRAAELLR